MARDMTAAIVALTGGELVSWSKTTAKANLAKAGSSIFASVKDGSATFEIRESKPPDRHTVVSSITISTQCPPHVVATVAAKIKFSAPSPQACRWKTIHGPELGIRCAAASLGFGLKTIRHIMPGRWEAFFDAAGPPTACYSFHKHSFRVFCNNRTTAEENYPEGVSLAVADKWVWSPPDEGIALALVIMRATVTTAAAFTAAPQCQKT